ncbi:MAG: PAS domain S-box protein [Gemmatimonadaceae bacterium]|nr:PAS domain S-box protein [Gemmatimonadaceae bacterium]
MTRSELDTSVAGSQPQLAGERLAELLSVISEAPDFSTAATFLVAQFADVMAARRAVIFAVDTVGKSLRAVGSVGLDSEELPGAAVPLEEHFHPLIVSALSLNAVTGDGCDKSRLGLPFEEWVSIPFPQPQYRGAPALLDEQVIEEISMTGCVIRRAGAADRRRRLGHAPGGVLVIEASVGEEQLSALTHAAALAGPVLSRMFAVEEYRRSTDQLDQQRTLLTAIINSLPDPIVIINAKNDIVLQNRRAEHLLSGTDADSEGRRRAVEINNLLFTSHLSKKAISAVPEAGSRELNLVDPDEGNDLLFEILTHELKREGPGDGTTVSILRDVTDLRRAAGELERQVQRVRLAEIDAKRERDRLNLILENVADPILVTDDRADIILMNRQAEQLFEANAKGGASGDLAVRSNDTKFTTFISDFTISPALSRREQMSLLVPGSGGELPVEVVSGKILNRRGEALAIVSVLHDLTEQVENERLYEELKKFSAELEQRISEATSDLAEQNARLQWQSKELEKASRLKSEFLASMSHELRTPINALIGYTALMLDRIYGDLTQRQEDGLRRVQAAAQHLLSLINDILDLAKIEAGKMPLHLEDAKLGDMISEITEQMEPLIRKKALEFICEVPPGDVKMHTDKTKVKQILLNLLSNAVKFTHAGHVRIVCEVSGGIVEFDVTDTGIGIREEHLEAIWEDFRQVDQSRTREFGGTGLGLSITRKLVQALGGEIAMSSGYGKGSTFTVKLPLRTTPRPEESVIASTEPLPPISER